ncbi:hypothetical protein [Methyloceanibacter marginalis]|uniref:hypothetical protein n=1 Tax=Methyloceanibacter marginalis TaxID=1774971 RepID=UPI00195BEB77|nr:hypothetical protein [Methyloceanibacter marginalis]
MPEFYADDGKLPYLNELLIPLPKEFLQKQLPSFLFIHWAAVPSSNHTTDYLKKLLPASS